MSDDDLESRLNRLGRSMSPGAGFADRVMKRVEPRPVFVPIRRVGWVTAAAALVTIVVRLREPGPTAPPVSVSHGPELVRTSSQFQTVSQRPVYLNGQIPARQVNCNVYERTRWTDPQDHTSFERVVPVERSSLVQPVMY